MIDTATIFYGLFIIVFLLFLFFFSLNTFNNQKNKSIKFKGYFSEEIYSHSEYQRYFLFFAVVIPSIEVIIYILELRPKPMVYNFLFGLVFILVFIISVIFDSIKKYLHRIFQLIFLAYLTIILVKISSDKNLDLISYSALLILMFLSFNIIKNKIEYTVFISFSFVTVLLLTLTNTLKFETGITLIICYLLIVVINFIRQITYLNSRNKFLFANEIVNKGNSLVIATKKNGELIYCSETITKILGYNISEVLGMGFWKLTDDKEFIGEKYHDNYIKNRLYTRKLKCSDGQYKYIQWVDKQFGEDIFVGIGNDITEKVNLENQYQNLIENATDLIFETDDDGNFTYINSFSSKLLGYELNELMSMHFGNLVREDYRNEIIDYYTNELKNISHASLREFPIVKKNGEEIWISQLVTLKRNDFNEILGYSGIARDITLIRNLENENIQRQEKIKKYNNALTKLSTTNFIAYDNLVTILRLIFENISESSNIQRISFWNYQIDRIECVNLYDLQTKSHSNHTILFKKDLPIYFESIEKEEIIIASDVENQNETSEFVDLYFKKHNIKSLLDYPVFIDGKLYGIICFEATGNKRYWDNEDINFTRSVSEIISIGIESLKRKEIENNLKYKSELLTIANKMSEKILTSKNIYNEINAIFESIGKITSIDRIYLFETNESTRTVSQKYEWVNQNIIPQMDNPELQEVPYELILDVIVPLKAKKIYNKLVKNIYESEFKELLKSQNILSVLIIPLQVQNKTIGFIGFDDCTYERIWSEDEITIFQTLINYISSSIERLQNEDTIYESQERFRLLAENIPGTVYLSKNDDNWTKIYINDEIENLTGYSKNDFLENKISYINLIHPEDKAKAIKDQKRALAKGEKIHQIYRIIKKDQSIAWVEEFGDSIKKDEGIDYIEGIFIDITEKKIKEDAIKEKEMAVAANKAKSDFLANMSHEIRTPLNGIVGFTELLMHTQLNKSQEKYMKTVNQSAKSLMGLINDILDFSKIESGNLELNVEEIKLEDLANQVIDTVKYEAIQKKLAIDLFIDAEVPNRIWIDPVRIKQVLINLMGNAVKFTATGHIKLTIITLNKIDIHQTIIRFSVIDTGIGIKSENQAKIFEAFSQEDSSTSKQFGGTGLGLSISNKILELMNSKLQLTSYPNQGSTFYFDLIVQSSAKENPKLNKKKNEGEIAFTSHFEAKVLIVEDNNINSLLAKTLIKKILPNCTIQIASNGIEAIENCKETLFDIIFMDIQMPVMNGYESTIEIRKNKLYKNIPIIALTAGTVIGEKEKCLEIGMNDYLSKPIVKGSLEHIIANWLKN